MRLRHIPGAEETIAASPYVVQDPQAQKGRWNLLFGNANPIQIEVGMGKGRFIMELAQKTPGSITSASSAIPACCSGACKRGLNWSWTISFYVH